MTAGFDPSRFQLTSPGKGAQTYARTSAATAPLEPTPAKTSRVTSTRVGLNLGKFQLDYTSHSMTFDLAEVVHNALQDQDSPFAEELRLAREQQTASGPKQETDTPTPIPPRRAALAYAKAQSLDTSAAAMHSLGSI